MLSGHKSLKQQFLRQSVQITGLNTSTFQKCIDNLHRINDAFSRSLPANTLEIFFPDKFGNYSALNFSTRYFTSRNDDPIGSAIPFNHSVDPHAVLTSMTSDRYFHGVDNEVLYYARIENDGKYQ